MKCGLQLMNEKKIIYIHTPWLKNISASLKFIKHFCLYLWMSYMCFGVSQSHWSNKSFKLWWFSSKSFANITCLCNHSLPSFPWKKNIYTYIWELFLDLLCTSWLNQIIKSICLSNVLYFIHVESLFLGYFKIMLTQLTSRLSSFNNLENFCLTNSSNLG